MWFRACLNWMSTDFLTSEFKKHVVFGDSGFFQSLCFLLIIVQGEDEHDVRWFLKPLKSWEHIFRKFLLEPWNDQEKIAWTFTETHVLLFGHRWSIVGP